MRLALSSARTGREWRRARDLRWPAGRASAIWGRREPSPRRLCSRAPSRTPWSPFRSATIYDTVMALRREEVDWAVVPIENSLDGSVSVTLDLLAGEASDVEIVGEALLRVRHSLIAGGAALAGGDRHGAHPSTGPRAVHAVPARRAGARADPAGELDRRGGADRGGRSRLPAAGLAALGNAAGGGDLRRHGAARRRGGPRRQRNAIRLAGASDDGAGEAQAERRRFARAPPREWKTSLVFWGPGAERAGLARALPGRVRAPGHQPDEDRVAAPARAPGELHVLRRPQRPPGRNARSQTPSQACARCASRCACSAPIEPAQDARLRPRLRNGRRSERAGIDDAPLHSGAEDGKHSPTRAGGVRAAFRAPAARTWDIAHNGDGWSGARSERHV